MAPSIADHPIHRRMKLGTSMFALAFALACPLSGCSQPTKVDPEQRLIEVQEDLEGKESLALADYFNKSPAMAIDSMQRLVIAYENASGKPDVPEQMRQALRYDELIARGRLVKLYRQTRNEPQAENQTAAALAMSGSTMGKRLDSQSQLLALVEDLDSRMRGRWKR